MPQPEQKEKQNRKPQNQNEIRTTEPVQSPAQHRHPAKETHFQRRPWEGWKQPQSLALWQPTCQGERQQQAEQQRESSLVQVKPRLASVLLFKNRVRKQKKNPT